MNIIKHDDDVNNVSVFVYKAIQYYLSMKYGATFGEDTSLLDQKLLTDIHNFVPPDQQEEVIKVFGTDHGRGLELLDEYLQKTFIDGPEEIYPDLLDLEDDYHELIDKPDEIKEINREKHER